MERPPAIKWIAGILFFRLIVVGILLVFGVVTVVLRPETGVMGGIGEALLKKMNLETSTGSMQYDIGFVVAVILISGTPIVLQYVFVRQQRRTGFWIAFAVDLLLVLSGGALPIILIPVFILALTQASRRYFNAETAVSSNHDVLDGNLQ